MFLYGGSKPPPYAQNPNIANKQNKNYTSVFRQRTDFTHARHTFFSGRADNACTNLLGFFVWYVRTRGMAEVVGAVKPPTFTLSCAALRFGRRTARVLLADFWYFSSVKSTIKEKLLYVFSCQYRRESTKNHHNADSQKRGFDSPFFCLFT